MLWEGIRLSAAIEQLRPCKHLARWRAYDNEKGSEKVLRLLWEKFLINKILDKHQSRMAFPPATVWEQSAAFWFGTWVFQGYL